LPNNYATKVITASGAMKNGRSLKDVNMLSIVNEVSDYLPSRIGVVLNNLKAFSVTNSALKSLRRSNFEGMQLLWLLRLSNNKIERIPEDAFWDLDNLQELRLDNNRIKVIPPNTLKSLKFLRVLNVNNNEIEFVDKQLTIPTRFIQQILASDNKLRIIDFNPDRYEFVAFIDLQRNTCINRTISFVKMDLANLMVLAGIQKELRANCSPNSPLNVDWKP